MKKREKLRIGIIGLGRILNRHLDDSIKQLKETELVAVCDIDRSLTEKIAQQENVKGYTDYKKLVKDPSVDLVIILTPNYLHYEIGLYVAKQKKHCIMEKPISQNLEQAKTLVSMFEKNNCYLFPVLQVRYNPAIRVVREHVKKGYLGKILTAVLSVHWTRPQEYYDESPWKGKKDLDGGSLLTQAIHFIDIMQWILGPAKSIYGKVATVGHRIEVEDIANAIIDLKSGTRVSFDFTVCTYPHNLESSLTILGETGTIKIDGAAMNKINIWEVKNTPAPYIAEGLTPNIYAGGMYMGSCPNHRFIYQNVINVLLKKKKNNLGPSETFESLKIIDGIIQSSREKKEIFY